MRLDSLTEAKLRNYAILAHEVLKSPDLTHLVLSALDRRTQGGFADEFVLRLTGVDPRQRPGGR